MTISVVAVHPTTVIVKNQKQQFELPIDLFLRRPRVGQVWEISLEHEPTEEERISDLNALLPST